MKDKYSIGCDVANGEYISVTTILKKHPDGIIEVLNINEPNRSFMDEVCIISERKSPIL